MTGVRWASAQVTGPSLQAHLEQQAELLVSMQDSDWVGVLPALASVRLRTGPLIRLAPLALSHPPADLLLPILYPV